ncbi:MAG: ATPase, T2SS/T4P/T4SS family [Oscillospiraceae bacterium]
MLKTPLGLRLVDNGVITEGQLQQALKYQNDKMSEGVSIKLGGVLIELGFCKDEDISKARSDNSGYGFTSLNNMKIDINYVNLIPQDLAKRYKAMAIGIEDGKLLVAMENPNDLLAIDDLNFITGYQIKPIIVSDTELNTVIEHYTTHLSNFETDDNDDEDILDEVTEESEKPAVLITGQIINNAIRTGASDIHIEPQEKSMRVRYRIDGVLHEVMEQSSKIHPSIISRIKVLANMDIAERRVPQDGRATIKVDGKTVDLRIASLPSAYGEKITIRLLHRDSKVVTIQDLGFPDSDQKRFMSTLKLPYGFLLVTGPTGSGKSTTLYASLGELNTVDKNIITLEDPVEKRMEGLNQVQMNAKANMTFASGLRSILRSDPDVIMIGEIRDRETAQIAVESALTGHFVLSTLHTNDSASAVTRLGEMGVENFLTASSLVGVIAQRLVRVLCPKCKEEYTISREEILAQFPDFPIDKDAREIKLYKAHGCISCNSTGYKGRRGVYEFMQISEEIRHLILKRGTNHEIQKVAIEEGMTTLRDDGFKKVKDGITSIEEVLRVIV